MTNDKDSAVLADEAREQVAKAILNHRSPMQPDTEWAISADETREWYRELADAAITAWNTRQPTQSDALAKAAVEIETLRAALKAAEEKLAAIEAENQRVTQSQIADLKRHLKEQDEVREAAKWSSQ